MSGKRGAPKIWGSEAAMFAIWELVRLEIDRRGAKSVRNACAAIMKRANCQIRLVKLKPECELIPQDERSIKDYDLLSRELMSINDHDKEDALRSRYNKAERNRFNVEKYPYLAQRTAIYLQVLEQEKMR
jgi:hypothetical protein